MSQTGFLRLSAIAACITVVTTIGVHFVSFQAATFEERLLLASNDSYIMHRWMIIFHCLMVILSMCGAGILVRAWNKGLATLGFLFFSVFGIAEITRMFSVLVYLNPLRLKYLNTSDESIRQLLQLQIDTWSQHGSMVLFLLFILAFALGNVCYGIALIRTHGIDKWLGWGFLLNGLTSSLAFANTFWDVAWIGEIVEFSSKFYQPVIRLFIGIWLWRKAAGA